MLDVQGTISKLRYRQMVKHLPNGEVVPTNAYPFPLTF
jgi:hypothetical protein